MNNAKEQPLAGMVRSESSKGKAKTGGFEIRQDLFVK